MTVSLIVIPAKAGIQFLFQDFFLGVFAALREIDFGLFLCVLSALCGGADL